MRKRIDAAIAVLALGAVLAMAVARGWLSDDAFITFRVVEQMARGEGPVFNAGERVQVFTHPLWMLALAAWSSLGGSLHPGAIVLSLFVFAAGLAAFGLAFRDRPLTLAVVLVAFFCCRTLTDYASSGLETPLAFALLMLAVWALRAGRRGVALLALALLPLTRADLVFLALPFVLTIPASTPRVRFAQLVAFAAPAAAWMAFSTVYYGVPVPNTAFAKIADSAAQRLDHAVSYVLGSLVSDPGALAIVLVALALGIARWRRDALVRAALAALVLTLGYVLWAGGDFMLGRFMLPCLWAGLVGIAAALPAPRTERRDAAWLAALTAVLALAHAVTGQTTLRTQLGVRGNGPHTGPWFHIAIDERRYYLPWLGLFPTERFEDLVASMGPLPESQPRVVSSMGVRGYALPRDDAVVDHFALAEPFLARLRPLVLGRPGHPFRPLPEGFLRWRDPAHHFADPRLDALAHDLWLAHRAPELFTRERAAAIARLLRTRPLRLESIERLQVGDRMRLSVRPRMLNRALDFVAPGVTWISRSDCGGDTRPYEGGYLVEAAADGDSHFDCPAQDFDRIPLWVSGGTIQPGNPSVIRFDERVPVVRDPYPWLPQVPRWTTAGHAEGSALPLAVTAALLVLAALLVKISRNPARKP